MISHAHLFGVKQVHDSLNGREQWELGFQTLGLYRYLRPPIMAGFVIAFWATPRMTVGHLVFALATTGYILVAVQLEERDLIEKIAPAGDRVSRAASIRSGWHPQRRARQILRSMPRFRWAHAVHGHVRWGTRPRSGTVGKSESRWGREDGRMR